MDSSSIVIAICDANEGAKIRAFAEEEIHPSHRNRILVSVVETRAASNGLTPTKKVQALIDPLWESGSCTVLLSQKINCDVENVLLWCNNLSRGPVEVHRLSQSGITKRLSKFVQLHKLHWRDALAAEIAKHTQHVDGLDFWFHQFENLGVGWLGSLIAKQVKIIDANTFEGAYQNIPSAEVVLSVGIQEEDAGASSKRMAAILAQHSGTPRTFDEAVRFTGGRMRVVHCEDGLWSGTETLNLLRKLASGGSLFDFSNVVQLTFRHFVQTDYGLEICRHFCRHYGLERIEFTSASGLSPLKVLPDSLSTEEFNDFSSMSPIEFERWLAPKIEPLFIRQAKLNGQDAEQAKEFLEAVQGQLSRRYLQHEYRTGRIRDEIFEEWKYGGRRIGATLGFSHTIPKSCLPVLWLGGKVKFRDRSLTWKPLIRDIRNVVPDS